MPYPLCASVTKLSHGLGIWAQSHAVLVILVAIAVLYFKGMFGGISAAWTFFTHRYDFMESGFEKARQNVFSFSVLQHSITAVRGINARAAFYDSKSLSFNQGYVILMGGAPRIGDIDIPNDGDDSALFVRRLSVLLRKERLSEVIPTLLDDIRRRMDSWGAQGSMDPFNNIYDIVFQMTVRLAFCRELASDLSALTEFQKHYLILEKSATPTALLFPWLPSPAKLAKETSTKALFAILMKIMEERKNTTVTGSEAIDLLLAQGMNTQDVIQFVLSVIFAGVVNTGVNACWILLYISIHAQWKSAIHAEIQTLLAQHTNPSEPLHKRLSAIPISFWEDATPNLDLAIRETIRLVVNFTALRRNLPGKDGGGLKIPGIDGEVPNGEFLAYNMPDAHLNPDVYTNPEVFDPDRYSPGREEDKRVPYAYLGWGVGRHPCAGMKIAKLELKIIVSIFVVGYEYDVVDLKGRLVERPPSPDYNQQQQARPKGGPYLLKFKRVAE